MTDDKQEERYSIAWYYVDNESGEEIPWDDAEKISKFIPESLVDGMARFDALATEAEHLKGRIEVRHHTDAEYDATYKRADQYRLWIGTVEKERDELKIKVKREASRARNLKSRLHVEVANREAWVKECGSLRAELAETKAEVERLKAKLNEAWKLIDSYKAEVERLRKDAPPLIYDSNAKMWILAGAVLLRNQAGDLLGIVRASDYYEKKEPQK